jgi:hypothetical protein
LAAGAERKFAAKPEKGFRYKLNENCYKSIKPRLIFCEGSEAEVA